MLTHLNFKNMEKFIRVTLNRFGDLRKEDGTHVIESLIGEAKEHIARETGRIGEWEDLELQQAHI